MRVKLYYRITTLDVDIAVEITSVNLFLTRGEINLITGKNCLTKKYKTDYNY